MSGMCPQKLSAVGELLGEHLGLRFTPDRRELERALARAATAAAVRPAAGEQEAPLRD